MDSRDSRSVVAERPRSRSSTNGVALESPEMEARLERQLRLSFDCEEIELKDVNVADTTFHYRLSAPTTDVKSSLEREGQETPIDLTGRAPHQIIDGFRRVAAARDLGWRTIKAFVHRGLPPDHAFRLAYTRNVVRKNLTPVERANAMLLGRQRGLEKEEIAKLFGISRKQVDRYLELAEFPDAIKAVLDGRTVTMAHARLLDEYRVKDAEGLAKRIETERLDAASLKKLLAAEGGTKRKPGRPTLCAQIKKDSVRFYSVRLTKLSSPAERDRVVGVLEAAIKAIKSW